MILVLLLKCYSPSDRQAQKPWMSQNTSIKEHPCWQERSSDSVEVISRVSRQASPDLLCYLTLPPRAPSMASPGLQECHPWTVKLAVSREYHRVPFHLPSIARKASRGLHAGGVHQSSGWLESSDSSSLGSHCRPGMDQWYALPTLDLLPYLLI